LGFFRAGIESDLNQIHRIRLGSGKPAAQPAGRLHSRTRFAGALWLAGCHSAVR